MKEIVILGGPIGSGKTTAAKRLLPRFSGIHEFLNADEIARAISPDDVELAAFAAGRKLLLRMQELIVRRVQDGGAASHFMTSRQIHASICLALDEVVHALASGRLDRSGRYYSDDELRERFSETSAHHMQSRSVRRRSISRRRPKSA